MSKFKHGYSNTHHSRYYHYKRWIDIISRCTDPKHKDYSDYGGRGIQIASEWLGEEGLKIFCEWAEKTYISESMLDRKDNDKKYRGYSSENCRWVNIFVSNDNRRPPKRKDDLPKGVYLHGRKYQVEIHKGKKYIYLGTFDTPEEASKVYEISRKEWVKENTT